MDSVVEACVLPIYAVVPSSLVGVVAVLAVIRPSLVGVAAVLAVIRAKREDLPAIVRALMRTGPRDDDGGQTSSSIGLYSLSGPRRGIGRRE